MTLYCNIWAMTRRDRNILVFFAAALGLVFLVPWFTGWTFFARDLTFLFHPMHVFTAENLQAGRLPLWNPHVSGGVYWVGQPQTGLFSPGHLPFWIFSFVPAFTLFQALHFLLSGLGGYLLVRSRCGPRWVALAAALLWSLNGFWRARVEFPPLLAVLTWTPWAVLFVSGLKRGSASVGFAVTAALALLAGHWPHAAWMGACAGAALFALSPGRSAWGRAVAAGAAGAALAAVQVLPGLDLLAQSDRLASGFDRAVAGLHALSPTGLLGLLSPVFSEIPAARYTGERFFWLGCFYVGLVGFLLALDAGRRAPIRSRWAWGGLAAAGALLSLGGATPAYDFFFAHVPLFRGVRYPAQYTYWIVAAVLAFFSLHGSRAFRPWARWPLVLLVLGELAFWGAALHPVLPGRYFRSRPAWVEKVHGREGRLFLSPKAVGAGRAEGSTTEETWTRLRHRLLSLGTLPYRIDNLNPFGFSLNPARNENILSRLYAAGSLEEAEPALEALGARWVAAPGPVAAGDWRLVSTETWHLYEKINFKDGVLIEGLCAETYWKRDRPSLGRWSAAGPRRSGGQMRTRDIWQKDWKAYGGGARLAIEERDGFAAIPFSDPLSRIDARFDPASWKIGLLVTLTVLTAALALGIRFFREERVP